MQHKRLFTFFGITDFVIELLVAPFAEHLWLALGEVTAHGKLSFRQIQGRFVIAHESLNPVLYVRLNTNRQIVSFSGK